jgi:hypothetical protein
MNRLLYISKRFVSKCGKDCSKCPLNKNLKIDSELSLKLLRRKQKEETKRFYQRIDHIPNDFIDRNLYFSN